MTPGLGNGDDFGTGERLSGDRLSGVLKVDGIGEVVPLPAAAADAIDSRLPDRFRRNVAAGDICPSVSSSLLSLLLSLLLRAVWFVALFLLMALIFTTLLLVDVGERLFAVFAAHDADL